jgi:phosphoenolpyruvate-protein kinase (PTS system EI component)
MVSSVEEVVLARLAMAQAQAALATAGVAHAEQIEIGIMVEIPAVAMLIDGFAPHVDFFSIGTNDLTQYTLAVDRTNPGVADLADALHPAVVRLIAQIIECAHAHGKWVGMCGEMAGNPLAIPLLLGLGLDEFSMASPAIPTAKAQLRTLTVAEAQTIAHYCLRQTERQAIQAYLASL